MVRVALAEAGKEGGHVGLGHRREGGVAGGVEVLVIAPEVTAVGGQRVRGDPALDGQVVEVGPGCSAELAPPVRCAVRRQRRTSSTGTQDIPCASATWS